MTNPSKADTISKPRTHRFTVAEFTQLIDVGIFPEDERVELIEGEIIHMAPIGHRHVECVNRLNLILAPLLAAHQVIVSIQNPILLDDYSQPQPDLVVARYRQDIYKGTLPTPADILFLVEVSDSSDEYDRNEKLPVYARAGIPETWLIDLNRGVIEVYRTPGPDGYREMRRWLGNERISPALLPDFDVSVSDLLS